MSAFKKKMQVDASASSSSPSTIDSLKENTPLRPTRTNSDTTMTSLSSLTASKSNKRRVPDELDPSSSDSEDKGPLAKRAKTTTAKQARTSGPVKLKETKPHGSQDHATEQFPNGYFYCHQCNKKRDILMGIQCTVKDDASKVGRCKLRYCKACLSNRYGEDLDEVKSHSPSSLSKKQKAEYVSGVEYYYRCPKCRDSCNCRICRKAKGLEPTGNLRILARKAGVATTDELLKNPKATHEALQKPLPPKPKAPKAAVTRKLTKAPEASTSEHPAPQQLKSSRLKPVVVIKSKPKPPPKPIPKPVWTRLDVPLNLEQTETRIHIREFILRFAEALQIATTNVEELECFVGEDLGESAEWEDEDSISLVGWVSDPCVKAMILGLLDVILTGAEANGAKEQAKHLKDAARSIRSNGPNLNRMWSVLQSLRDSMRFQSDNKPYMFTFSDPLPPPAAVTFHNTRNTRSGQQNTDSSVHVAVSAQFVPVISDLIEAAMSTPAIRQAMEAGAADEKELAKEVREAITKANNTLKEANQKEASAEPAKKAKGEMKATREQHKQRLHDIEYSHRLLNYQYIPRFTPLGRDADGRVYYALSPGIPERDSAEYLLKGKDIKPKFGRKRGGISEDDRREMERWSWFIGIYGTKPVGAEVAKRDEEDEDDDDDDELSDLDEETENRWWGFWDPKEIDTLSKWISYKFRLEDNPWTVNSNGGMKVNGAGSTKATVKSLAKGKAVSRTGGSLFDSREDSPLSDISDDESEEEPLMRMDSNGHPIPTRQEMKTLVKALNDYADMLRWRVQRAAPVASDANTTPEVTPKPTIQPVPAKSFYA
ncbi:hypothetical protein ABKN59_005402 [Abortiporus biennis]